MILGWGVAVLGAAAGALALPIADRWCPRTAGLRERALAAVLLGGVFGALAVRAETTVRSSPWTWVGLGLFATLGVVMARVDLATFRLPDALTLSGYPLVGLPLALGNPAAAGRALVAAAACFLGYGVLCAMGGLGFGDVKLGGLIGLVLGWISWRAVVLGTLAALLLGAVHALALVVTGRGGRKVAIPYGPAMLVGGMIAVLALS